MTTVFSSLLFVAAVGGSAWAEGEEEGDPCGGGEGDVEAGGEAEVALPPADGTVEGSDAAAMEGGAPPLITPKGKISVHVGLALGLSKDNAGKPISITPDVFYGVAPKLEVGVAHSGYALDGFWGDSALLGIVGTGVCVSGDDMGAGCAKVYNGPVGLLARYSLMEGSIDLAADGGIVVRSLDPDMLLGVKVGVRGRKMINDKMAIGFAPSVTVGLNSRDGNGDFIAIPVDIHYAVSPKLMAGLQTGVEGDLDGFGDNYALPIGVGGVFMLNDKMAVGGAFILHRVVGGLEGPGAADLRSLAVFFGWHN